MDIRVAPSKVLVTLDRRHRKQDLNAVVWSLALAWGIEAAH